MCVQGHIDAKLVHSLSYGLLDSKHEMIDFMLRLGISLICVLFVLLICVFVFFRLCVLYEGQAPTGTVVLCSLFCHHFYPKVFLFYL